MFICIKLLITRGTTGLSIIQWQTSLQLLHQHVNTEDWSFFRLDSVESCILLFPGTDDAPGQRLHNHGPTSATLTHHCAKVVSPHGALPVIRRLWFRNMFLIELVFAAFFCELGRNDWRPAPFSWSCNSSRGPLARQSSNISTEWRTPVKYNHDIRNCLIFVHSNLL